MHWGSVVMGLVAGVANGIIMAVRPPIMVIVMIVIIVATATFGIGIKTGIDLARRGG